MQVYPIHFVSNQNNIFLAVFGLTLSACAEVFGDRSIWACWSLKRISESGLIDSPRLNNPYQQCKSLITAQKYHCINCLQNDTHWFDGHYKNTYIAVAISAEFFFLDLFQVLDRVFFQVFRYSRITQMNYQKKSVYSRRPSNLENSSLGENQE